MKLGKNNPALLVEPEGFEGVRRIAGRVARDIEAVTGFAPAVVSSLPEGDGPVILCATLGRSPLADRLLSQGVLDEKGLRGRREVFQLRFAWLEGREALVICGSDKRGTIYGMFTLSEYIGVSPLCYWGDAAPQRRDSVLLGRDIEQISREPSVRYRGFFINDEWPCFGTWATSHFGDVNASCYEQVFELLLRLKGNYLWPAMWRSSFPLDGPGSANEELADLYGVVMGYSHHEPCLRASEEWDKVRGENSPYGNEWNFYTNEEGLLRYWEDALKRSGKYENIITIGMRGERDSCMLGEDSTLEENIDLLKRIITKQRGLIRRCVPRQPRQMLALYKEVERYFCGDEQTEGLRSWKELDDVLFLLCEDNFGHLRTVPPRQLRDHPGGWGMYYHFDYHGGPVSYEWVDSTPLSQVWEQMTAAWEYGIRELWIVNVGDLKLHEVPLSYFLALAYDFDRWGSGDPDSPRQFLAQWTARTFPEASDGVREQIASVFRDYVAMNALRRPEALHAGVYHPCHWEESDRMLDFAEALERRSCEVLEALCPRERDAYYSMIHFPAMASANLLKLHLYAGKNAHYAAQGKVIANRYFDLAEKCIHRDWALGVEFAAFRDGKWAGMELAPHIGFTKWNSDDSRYPVLCRVTPMDRPCMKVSRADEEAVATKTYGAPMVIPVPDFLYAGVEAVTLEIANGGAGSFRFAITGDVPEWLRVEPAGGTVTEQTRVEPAGGTVTEQTRVEPAGGTVTEQTRVVLRCDRDKLPKDTQRCTLYVSDGDARVALEISGRAAAPEGLPPRTFMPREGAIVMLAEHCCAAHETDAGAFRRIPDFGKFGSGMKVFPPTAEFDETQEKPSLTYSFVIDEPGEYPVTLLTAPNNPVQMGRCVEVLLESGAQHQILELLPASFRAGENSDSRWTAGVLDQVHTAQTTFRFESGLQTLTVGAMSPGVVLEKIIIGTPKYSSCLGPEETFST